MRFKGTAAVLAFALVALFGQGSVAAEGESQFHQGIVDYYNVSTADLANILIKGISNEDLPVVFHISQKSGQSAEKIADLRLRGDHWLDIAKVRGLGPKDFYVLVMSDVTSKTYAPIMAKFKATPVQNWNQLELTDSDIVNLVNLKFIASHNDYSIFETMSLRDNGQKFVQINSEISTRKAAWVARENEKRAKAAVAKADTK